MATNLLLLWAVMASVGWLHEYLGYRKMLRCALFFQEEHSKLRKGIEE